MSSCANYSVQTGGLSQRGRWIKYVSVPAVRQKWASAPQQTKASVCCSGVPEERHCPGAGAAWDSSLTAAGRHIPDGCPPRPPPHTKKASGFLTICIVPPAGEGRRGRGSQDWWLCGRKRLMRRMTGRFCQSCSNRVLKRKKAIAYFNYFACVNFYLFGPQITNSFS